MGVIRRLARVGLRAGLVVFLATLGAVLVATLVLDLASRRIDPPVDAVIVLGGDMTPDAMLAYETRQRVREGVALLEEGRTEMLILSGGFSPTRERSDAAIMRDFALDLGAPADRLLIEDRAVSTFENLRHSFPIAEARGLERLALLTDPYHLARARALAAYWGRDDVVLYRSRGFARSPLPFQVVKLSREALAWWYNLAKIAGWEALGLAGLPPEARARWVR
jgi:uncharacterized SAM-binding protein YcdF (DUF218 family)